MFKIGDKIAYPMHGAGVIEGVENKRILGEEHQYYILKLSMGEIKVMVPIAKIEEIGIRYVVSEEQADVVIQEFRADDNDDSDQNWNKRYRENIEKLKIGKLHDVAHVTKTLLLRDKRKSLSNAERKMLNNAKNVLISELVLSKNTDYQTIENLLMNQIS